MKQNERVAGFKARLNHYIADVNEIERISSLIALKWHELGCDPKTSNPSKEPISGNPVKNIDREYKIRDEIDDLTAEISRLRADIKYCDRILIKIEPTVRMEIIAVYVRHQPFSVVAGKTESSASSMQNRIDKAIKKAID